MKRAALAIGALLAGMLTAAPTVAQAECLTTPSPSGVVTSIYGWRFHPKYRRWRPHRGVDMRASLQTQLVATHAGIVQLSHSSGGGNEIRIIGNNGLTTRYLHLTRALVKPGTTVSAGQAVALSGNTGHASTAPHLHLELYGRSGKDENPEPLLCPRPSRKGGADESNGFPVTACNPTGGHCEKGSLPPPRGGGTAPGGPGGGGEPPPGDGFEGDEPMPPSPRMGEWDDMSLRELIGTEVARRHSNPDWRRELAQRKGRPLILELVEMMGLRAVARYQVFESKERIEAMLAARMLRRQKRDMEARLQRQREAAAKAAASR